MIACLAVWFSFLFSCGVPLCVSVFIYKTYASADNVDNIQCTGTWTFNNQICELEISESNAFYVNSIFTCTYNNN